MMSGITYVLAIGAASIATTIVLYLIPLLIRIARKLEILDIPDGAVKVHSHPVPYLGGIAIYLGFILSVALTLPVENKLFLIIVGLSILTLTGLIDDLLSLTPWQKLSGQAAATACFLRAGLYFKSHLLSNPFLNVPLFLLWIFGIINAVNLVDVMDGLATVIALMGAIGFMFCASVLDNEIPFIILAALVGALCGFLRYNKPQAVIYLGDAGSLLIGGILSIVPFLIDWGTYNIHGFIAPVIILAILQLEVAALVILRWYKGIPFYLGSPDHFYQFLQKKGWSRPHILVFISLMTLPLNGSAYCIIKNYIPYVHIIWLGIIYICFWGCQVYLKIPYSTIFRFWVTRKRNIVAYKK